MAELDAYRAGDKQISHGMEVALGINRDAGTINPGQSIAFDYGIAGIGFLSASSGEHPYQRGLAQVLKQAINNTTTPGDQALDTWWLRSQTDWSLGAGTSFMEPISDAKVQTSYLKSYGVNPWEEGKVSLLPAPALLASISAASVLPVISAWTTDGYFVSGGDTVTRVSSSGTKTAVTGLTAGQAVTCVVTGNGVVYVATTHAVYQILAGTTAALKVYTVPTPGNDTRAWFAKDRLLVTNGGSIWDLAPPSSTATTVALLIANALYTKSGSTTWIACTSVPGAVLLADSSPSGSSIYRLTLDTTSSLPQLSAPATAAEFPTNERIAYMDTYLGAYIAVATNLGIRIGTVDNQYGIITYGPRIGSPVATGRFASYDRFLYYPVADAGEGRSGVVRVDLSEVDETGRTAWSMDERVPANLGLTVQSCTVDSDGKVVLIAKGVDSLEMYRSSAQLEEYGFISSGAIRFGTSEKKYFDTVNIQVEPDWEGSVSVTAMGDGYAFLHVGSFTEASGFNVDLKVNSVAAYAQVNLGITLVANQTRAKGPVLQAWQIRALPSVIRGRLIQVALFAFDRERDHNGVEYGWEGYAIERWRSLEDQIKDGWPFTYQDFNTGETYRGVLEQVSFTQVAPPANTSGFGGIIDLTIRTL